MLKLICAVWFVVLFFSASAVPAQKPNKFPDAIERSGGAGRIVSLLALTDSGLPRELIDNARAIGIFPRVRKEQAMLTSMTQGYGVISARLDDGWSAPAFYNFTGGGYGNPFAKNQMHSVIFLFMTKEALDWFEKGGVPLRNEKKALPGPVGSITDEQRKEMEGTQIFAYAYYNGSLNGTAFGKSFWKNFLLNPDNKINKPLYGMKGREVLAGKKVDLGSLPAGITDYREALQKHFPGQ